MNLLCVWTKIWIPLPVMAGKRLVWRRKTAELRLRGQSSKMPPIVILDEATAFTDPQNEDKIQKSIMALSKGKTLLVIAHRLSTIQNADQIVVLKKRPDCGLRKAGRIVEAVSALCGYVESAHRGEELVCE